MTSKWQEEDEKITVTLTTRDYNLLRQMLQREETLTVIGRWILSTGFVVISGLLATAVFYDNVKIYFKSFFKITGS